MANNSNTIILQPKRVRFSQNEILVLLKEVISQNPFEDPKRWVNILENVNKITQKRFSLRTIRNQTNHLVLNWNKQDRNNRGR